MYVLMTTKSHGKSFEIKPFCSVFFLLYYKQRSNLFLRNRQWIKQNLKKIMLEHIDKFGEKKCKFNFTINIRLLKFQLKVHFRFNVMQPTHCHKIKNAFKIKNTCFTFFLKIWQPHEQKLRWQRRKMINIRLDF